MDEAEARARLASQRRAFLATTAPDGTPHVVPVTFVLDGDMIHWAVDAKPKSGRRLARIRHIETDPRVTITADHYEEDWTKLWWVMAVGRARIATGDEAAAARRRLAGRYRQYRDDPAALDPVVAVMVERWRGWAAAGSGPG